MTGAALAILLFVAVQFFINAFNEHSRKERDLEDLDCQVRWFEENRREQAQKRRAMAQVKGFIRRARAFGLERHHWEHYDVNIEERLYFHEAKRILTQTANSESCYFHPISLNIKKIKDPATTNSGQAGTIANSGKDKQQGDLLLSLKGTFVVKQR